MLNYLKSINVIKQSVGFNSCHKFQLDNTSNDSRGASKTIRPWPIIIPIIQCIVKWRCMLMTQLFTSLIQMWN